MNARKGLESSAAWRFGAGFPNKGCAMIQINKFSDGLDLGCRIFAFAERSTWNVHVTRHCNPDGINSDSLILVILGSPPPYSRDPKP